jgi:diketogulonate reductase-like aldo/keto reductase
MRSKIKIMVSHLEMRSALFALLGAASSTTVTLSNGVEMPLVGCGLAGKLGVRSIEEALRAGYRLFDTAQAKEWYNEEDLGAALKKHPDISREELFLTTKMHPRDHGYERTKVVFEESLKNLGTKYIDLFMLHYPRWWVLSPPFLGPFMIPYWPCL